MKTFIKKLLRESLMKNKAVGVLIKCETTDKVFLMLRNDKIPTWSLVSGGLENGEEPIDCLKREVSEELSIDPNIISYKKVGVEDISSKNLTFHYYEGLTSNEFVPKLNHENLECGWFEKDNLPSPLFIGMSKKIKNI
jgi:8-oxo-dGTP pyrophosphatase MutT (NUDIX family)